MSERLQKLRGLLTECELDAILVSGAENRRYVSGFSGSSGYLLVTQDQAVLATDFRYIEQAGSQAPDFRVERVGSELSWLPNTAGELGVRRVGFESEHMNVATHSAFQKSIDGWKGESRPELIATTDIVDRFRAYKDEQELRLITKAIEIADEAIDEIAPTIEPG